MSDNAGIPCPTGCGGHVALNREQPKCDNCGEGVLVMRPGPKVDAPEFMRRQWDDDDI